jgi:hypothetical protein
MTLWRRYAADHQMAVIDCLEDRDETLKRKTVSFLPLSHCCAVSNCVLCASVVS